MNLRAPENMISLKREAMTIGGIQAILLIAMMIGIEIDLLAGKRRDRGEITKSLINTKGEEEAEVEVTMGDKKENIDRKIIIDQMIDIKIDENMLKEMFGIANMMKEDIESAMINMIVIIKIEKTIEETTANMKNMKKKEEEIMIIQINTKSQKNYSDTQSKVVDIQKSLRDM